MLSEAALALKFLQVILGLDELVDLFNEVRLGFSDDSLNFVDLLIDNLVDFLHMIKHIVGLLIKQVKLRLIALQLYLPIVHFHAGVILLDFLLDAVQDILPVAGGLRWIQLRVLMLPVVALDCLLAFIFDRATEVLDITRERLSKHLGVQPGELGEDVFEHEVLGNGV